MNEIKLGRLVEGTALRDAVHVAVAPVEAGEDLEPGDHVALLPDGKAWLMLGKNSGAIGIVDPFLRNTVAEGQTFWLCLYPGTVTSLRHAWTHPAFAARSKVAQLPAELDP